MKLNELLYLTNTLKTHHNNHNKHKEILVSIPKLSKTIKINYIIWNIILMLVLPVIYWYGYSNSLYDYQLLTTLIGGSFGTQVLLIYNSKTLNYILYNMIDFSNHDNNKFLKFLLTKDNYEFIINYFDTIEHKEDCKKKIKTFLDDKNIPYTDEDISYTSRLIPFCENIIRKSYG